MINIEIGNYKITADDKQFILSEKKKSGEKSKNPGEEYYKDIGYYPRLDSLVNSLIDLKIKRSDIKTLKELKDEYIKQTTSVWMSIR